MVRYRLTVEYDGRGYCGWQRQDNGPTIQQSLEEAAFRLCGAATRVHGSGRTDSGVHALGQVAHLDLPKAYGAATVMKALNAHLRPQPIAVIDAAEVAEDFHARFSAEERSYRYRILNRIARPTLDQGRVWWVARPMEAAVMDEAAQVLVGRHDFSSFRAAECQADSPVKTLSELRVSQVGDEIHVFARARSFLHHQVRNMVGTLALVGDGRWTADRLRAALEARDRSAAGPTAPPDGLYFLRVRFPGETAAPAMAGPLEEAPLEEASLEEDRR
ncbi:tRNA pseudouridine(38-40) synthase TruA [Rhodospirillum rubrum]|uniref:tRNA pseudouridine(38-40) synthase TruA n=1 Tax=Rhodospirillum rubrum TaxID=1085 RepID=UPI0019083B38|nr:tRNA pseudouridine(38-40) synthase TruA [Rhodospirillum rubrum]MBK1664531.1 tRNA pseudouridine(38-40) synthase TruA [Rhodospirillum rubrum]MBK1676214.1 tRNA pseudouridine(38-40) synthase TruA [Rhodospirillum rubrum]